MTFRVRMLLTLSLVAIMAPLEAQEEQADTAPPAPSAPDTTDEDPVEALLKELEWRLLGPAAFSGRITALAIPEPYHKTMYAGTASGGLWKSANDGTTWRPIGDKLGTQSIGAVAVAPSDTAIVWVGTGEKNSLRSNSWGNGVHKSADGGKTWKLMGLEDSKSIGAIVIHPRDPDVVYVAALGHLWGPHDERGIYKTTDGGETWNRVLFVNDTTGFVSLEMDPTNADVLYAGAWHRLRWGGGHMEGVGAGSGIYKTTDGGDSWTELTDTALDNGLPGGEKLGRIGLAIYRKNPRIVYAVIQNNQGVRSSAITPFGGVYRSTDAGRSWTQMNDLSAVPFYYYNEIWLDPNDSNHVFLNAAPLYESKDGGETFEAQRLTRVHVDHHAAWIDPRDSKHMILGNDGGVYITWDGGETWDQQVMPIGQFYTVTVDTAQQPYHVCGGLQDNGTWCGPSATRDRLGIVDSDWYDVYGGDGFHVQVPWHDFCTVYAESQFGNMGRVDLCAGERESIRPVAADAGDESGFDFRWGWNTPMVLSRFDSTMLYVGANHLIRMTDRGNDWVILGPDMTRGNRNDPEPEREHTSYRALFSIAESPRSRDILWTGSDDGLIWVSRDFGRAWTNTTDNLPAGAPRECFVNSIAASYHADARAYVVTDCHRRDDYRPYVYRTDDFGQTWQKIVEGLPDGWGALSVLEDVVNPDLLWVGTEAGVYVSLDRGAGWRKFNNNLPPVGVRMMSMAYRERDLVIGTFGRGIWVNPIGPLQEYSDTLFAQRAHLFRVAPARAFREVSTHPSFGSEPFIAENPPRGAIIRYWLRDSADKDVRLVITNVEGDTVRTLTGRGYPGFHDVTWDLERGETPPRRLGGPTSSEERRRVPGGTYTVTLEVFDLTLEAPIVVEEGWPERRLGRLR